MAIPRSSADYYRRQQRILATLLLAVRQVWQRMDPSARWAEQYTDDRVGAQLLMLVGAAQVAAARDADRYIADVLTEVDLVPDAEPGVVVPSGFGGVAGDGRPVETLLGLAVPRAGQAFNARRRALQSTPVGATMERPGGMSDVAWESLLRAEAARQAASQVSGVEQAAREALHEVGQWLEAAAASVVIDAARAAESAATTAHREVAGYVRMLNPPSCSRCVVLAGKWFRWNAGFDRHPPTCDCRHIPISEDQADDLRTHPDRYFDSLSRAEQDRTFTKAGAQAIRDGADINQVVNARRGMRKAQLFGRDALITTEGTTRHGIAFEALAQRGGTVRSAEDLAVRNTRTGPELRRINRTRARSPRVMPETIYQIAVDREDAIRLLQAHGFIHRFQ